MRTYLVTGASGVVGGEVVRALLAKTDATIRILLRASTQDEVEHRRRCLLEDWGLAERSAEATRLEAVAGDVGVPGLGMERADFERVADDTERIVHCAGRVRMNLPLDEARRSAVTAAHEILALAWASARQGRLEKLEYVSTVGVRGRGPGDLPETWVEPTRHYHNTYEAAKAEAEVPVREAAEAGLPVTVHRPSMVVGRSDTGAIASFQVFYHLCEFLSGRRTGGLYPRLGDAQLDIVPVDYVAAALVWSTTQPDTAGKVLHLCSGPRAGVRVVDLRDQVRERFASAGIWLPPIVDVPAGMFKTAIRGLRWLVPRRTRRALGTLPMFLDYLADDNTFGNERTRALLEPAGIHVPAPTDYLDAVLDFYVRQRGRA